MNTQFQLFAIGVLVLTAPSALSQTTRCTAKVGNNAGEIKVTGAATDGGGFKLRNFKLEIGNEQPQAVPGQPGVFRNVFVAEQQPSPLFATSPSSHTFTGLTNGKSYMTKMTAYFQWSGPGMPPGGMQNATKVVELFGNQLSAP